MFTVLKSGRESEHGLCEGGDVVGQGEAGVVGGESAVRLGSFGPTCSFAFTIAQEYRYHYS